jgi:hypothetical protein
MPPRGWPKKRIFTANTQPNNSGMQKPSLAIVILNWNGRHFLEKFLPGVVSHSPPAARIVVADNASTDGSLDWLKEHHPEVERIGLSRNLGYAGGYNAALRQIRADYVVLLNSDVEVSPGWVEPVLDLMEAHPQVAACQPKVLARHDRSRFEYAGAAGGFIDRLGYPFCRGRLFGALEKDLGQYDDERPVFWATGACLFVRASAFNECGGLDERFFAHMEEIDLCWRLQNRGYRVMACPRSVVYHIGGGSLPARNPAKTFLNFRNSLWMLAKNLPARHFYPTMILRLGLDKLAAAGFLLSGRPRDCLAVMRALWAFLGRLREMRRDAAGVSGKLPDTLYRKSLLWAYYVKRKRRFSELPGLEELPG